MLLDNMTPFLKALPTTIVLDHMSVPDVKKGVDHPDFQRYLALVAENKKIWVKVTCPERLSASGPPYDDVMPFARALVERFPDRVLWGTDWPHPNMTTHMPDDGQLVDMIPKFAPDRGAAEGAAGRQSDAALLGELRAGGHGDTQARSTTFPAPRCSMRRARARAITSTCSACR